MTIRRLVVGIGAAFVLITGWACGGSGDSGGPFMPEHGTVSSKTDSGGHGWPIHLCVKSDNPKDNQGKPLCDTFRRESTKNCHVGSRWPECRENS